MQDLQDNTPALSVDTDLDRLPAQETTPLSPGKKLRRQISDGVKSAAKSTQEFFTGKKSSEPTPNASPVNSPTAGTISKTILKSPCASADVQNKNVSIIEPAEEEFETSPAPDAAPATSSPDQGNVTPTVKQPVVTLGDAFGYTFSMAADIKTAQQMFRDACADHVYPVNSYNREEFISLLKEKLGYRARFASKEFFQVFMNIAAFVHQYVDPGLDQVIAATFAQAQKGPKWICASWLAPRMQCRFNNGMHAVYLCYLENTRMLCDLPEPGAFVEMGCMQVSAEFNTRLIEAAGDRVDTFKVGQNLETRGMWDIIQMKRQRAIVLARDY